ncbi:MAG: BatA domain-containing protein [Bacteroidia bacterium]|nr:BatA domain-containing protein [Bacteroidia bacterium]
MNFLYPSFLFALAAVSIPIIIHLFNFRKFKIIYFSNVRFLKNVQQETKAKSRLKHLLILLFRILTISALVFAFAQPFIPAPNVLTSPKQDIVGIYIDNSFSMDAESKYGNMLDVAKNKAKSIIDAYPASARFLLTTNDFELKHQHLVNREQLMEFVGKVQVSPNSRKLSDVLSRQKDFLSYENAGKSRNDIFIISDFQRSVTDIGNFKNDSNLNVQLLPITAQPANNLYIDSCWFETPFHKAGQQEELFMKIINKSKEAYNNIPVKAILNDSLKALGSFNILPENSEIVSLKFTNTAAGFFNGVIEISDYPIVYDNTFYFSFSISGNMNLLIINGQKESRYLSALYGSDDYFKVTNTNEKNIHTSAFSDFYTIILHEVKNISSGLAQELLNYSGNGGTVVFIPDFSGEEDSYNNFLSLFMANTITGIDTHKTRVEYVNYNNVIYSNVFQKKEENPDLPYVSRQFIFNEFTTSNDEVILKTQNKNVVLSVIPHGKGRLYVISIPLSSESNNFAKHPLFVPTFMNIALNSKPLSKLQYMIGRDNVIELTRSNLAESDKVFHIVDIRNKVDFIPRHIISNSVVRLFIENNITKAGNYLIKYNDEAIAPVAFNYDRKESDLSYYSDVEIHEAMEKYNLKNYSILDTDTKFLTKVVQQISKGVQLWKWFVILALFFIACEIAVIRLLK